MPTTQVLRCSFCGAPMDQPEAPNFRAQCVYCGIENRLLGAELRAAHQLVETLARAGTEADEIERLAETQRAVLEERLKQALLDDDGEAAVRHFEGILRMSYASTIHLYRTGMPPEHGEPALQQIDDVIRTAVTAFATEHGYAAPA